MAAALPKANDGAAADCGVACCPNWKSPPPPPTAAGVDPIPRPVDGCCAPAAAVPKLKGEADVAAGAAAVLDPKVKAAEGADCFASACFPNWKAPGAALAVVPAVVPLNWKAATGAAGAWAAPPNENTLPLLAVVVVVEPAATVEICAGAAPNEKLAAFGGAAAPNVNAGAAAVAPTVPAAGATWPNENSGEAAAAAAAAEAGAAAAGAAAAGAVGAAAPKVNAGLWEGAPPAPVPNWKAATGAAAVVTGTTAAGADVVTEPKREGAGAADATAVPKANGAAALLTGAAAGDPPKLKLTCLAVVSGAGATSPPLSLAAGCDIAVVVVPN